MYILGGKLYGICRVVMRNGMENIFMCGLCRDRLDVFYPFLSTALHYDTNACPLIVGDASFRCVLAMPFILTPRYELQIERKQSCNAYQTIAHEKVRDRKILQIFGKKYYPND